MKFIRLFLITWVFSVQAGLPPTTLSGQNSTSKPTTFNYKTPYYQSTQTGGINSLIETDSENMLINPNFEHGTISTGWTLGTSNTLTATTTSANLFSGKQAGLLTTSATVAFNFYQDVTPPSGLAGTQGEITWALNVPSGITDGQICSRINGTTSTTNCISVINNGVYREYSLPIIFGTAAQTAGLAFVTTATYASGAQTVIVDKARVRAGLSLSSLNLDNVYSAQVTTTSGAIANQDKTFISSCTAANPSVCTFTTGIFTVTPNCAVAPGTFSGNAVAAVASISATGFSINSFASNTGSGLASVPVQIVCQKTGNDYLSASSNVYSQASANYGWTSYTPTTPNSSLAATPTGITIATNDCKHKRDGQDLLIDCKITVGTPQAVEARLSLPTGLTSADTNLIPSLKYAGSEVQNQNGAYGFYVLIEPSVSYLTFSIQASGSTGLSKANASAMIGTSGVMSFHARVPIQGWSSSSQIIGSFSGYTNVPGQSGYVDTFSASFGTTNAATICTASPCSYLDQIGSQVVSVTRSATGTYAFTTSKTYSKLKCSFGLQNNGNISNPVNNAPSCSNCSGLSFLVNDSVGNARDVYGNINCIGTY